MSKLRRFTANGLASFRSFLSRGAQGEFPHSEPEYSTEEPKSHDLEYGVFSDRVEFSDCLKRSLLPLPIGEVFHDVELWSWISAKFFDFLAPIRPDGTRQIGQEYNYIPSKNYRFSYRHLARTPWFLRVTHGDNAIFLLNPAVANNPHPLARHGDMIEQLASRQFLISSETFIGAASALYLDAKGRRAKRGATARKKRGNVRRLVALANQLDLTFHFPTMSSQRLLELTPPEFNAWKS